jgi:Arc/MetJ family transcription regulator
VKAVPQCPRRCARPTTLAIDDDLLQRALEVGGHRTKRETVDEALREYVERRLRLEAVTAFGTIDFDPDFDYKESRAPLAVHHRPRGSCALDATS